MRSVDHGPYVSTDTALSRSVDPCAGPKVDPPWGSVIYIIYTVGGLGSRSEALYYVLQNHAILYHTSEGSGAPVEIITSAPY